MTNLAYVNDGLKKRMGSIANPLLGIGFGKKTIIADVVSLNFSLNFKFYVVNYAEWISRSENDYDYSSYEEQYDDLDFKYDAINRLSFANLINFKLSVGILTK